MKNMKSFCTFAIIIWALCSILHIGLSVMYFVDSMTVLGLSYTVFAVLELAIIAIYIKLRKRL